MLLPNSPSGPQGLLHGFDFSFVMHPIDVSCGFLCQKSPQLPLDSLTDYDEIINEVFISDS